MSIDAIELTIYQAFEIGKKKDLNAIQRIHSKSVSKFSDIPPYNLQDYNDVCLHEELFFASISDYNFKIHDLKIDLFDNIALATFILEQEGILVNNYNFTGERLHMRSRATMVLKNENKREWRIIHEHYSIIPER